MPYRGLGPHLLQQFSTKEFYAENYGLDRLFWYQHEGWIWGRQLLRCRDHGGSSGDGKQRVNSGTISRQTLVTKWMWGVTRMSQRFLVWECG